MFKTVLSSSSNSVDKAMDEYHDLSSFSGSSDDSSNSDSSSGGNTTDQYTSGILGVPLKVLQEGLRMRASPNPRPAQVLPCPQFRTRRR